MHAIGFILSVILFFCCSSESRAETYNVPQSEFGSISKSQQKQIESQLIKNKILKPGDKLKYSGASIDQEDLDPATVTAILVTVGPLVCQWIVEEIAESDKDDCKKVAQSKRKSCAAEVDKWSKRVQGLCGIIKVTKTGK